MKTQINLYSVKLHPRLRLLSLPLVSAVWVSTLVVGLVIYGVTDYQAGQVQTQLSHLEQQNTQQQRVLTTLEQDLANFSANPELLAQLNQKQQQVLLKQRVLKELSGQAESEKTGFAGLMRDLATHHHQDIGLRHIAIDQDNVTIKGVVSQSQSLPQWMAKLTQTQSFAGKTFSQTSIVQADQQLEFVLASLPAELPLAEAQQ